MKYILKDNLCSVIHGFVNDDYESDYGLLRGHLLDGTENDLGMEIMSIDEYNKIQTE